MKTRMLVAFGCLVVSARGAHAQLQPTQPTSTVVPFSGTITGQPDGPVAMRFRMFPVSTGGVFCFEESQSAVPVTAAAFTAALGDGTIGGIPTACFSGNTSLWISFALESAPDSELGARIPITSSGYAHFALTPAGPAGPPGAAGADGAPGAPGAPGPAGPSGPNDVVGNLTMVNSTSTTGNILKDGVRFMHNFGVDNAFLGREAGNLTMTGPFNTGIGRSALTANTSGSDNTGTGVNALFTNTTGKFNTANGSNALVLNTTGVNNTATGASALVFNTTGVNNTATGYKALLNNTTSENTAVGSFALQSNTSGAGNTAVGFQALVSNTSGSSNTAIGESANISSGVLSNVTVIGAGAVATNSNMVRLGNTAVTLISGQVAYTFPSDSTKKENFRPVDGELVLQKISAFRSRSWNYIGHDPKQFRHYGPMAQEFYAAFGQDGVGTIGSPTTINSGDISGILMVAVQTLAKENAILKARLDALERTVTTGSSKQ